MDDDIWDVRFHFDGRDNLERTICHSDITYLNFLGIIETEGYGMHGIMYYISDKGKGVSGLELIDGMAKVERMLKKCEDSKCISNNCCEGQI